MQILDFTEGVEGEEAAVAEAEAAEEEVCLRLLLLRAYKSPCSRPLLLTQSVLLASCTGHDMAHFSVAVPDCTSCTEASCAHSACCAL